MKNRPIYNSDLPTLQAAIDADKFHPGKWKVEVRLTGKYIEAK